MKMRQLDKSNYYKGLLVLARKDRVIHEQERKLLIEFGRALDFDQRFCEAAIADLLTNRHITDEPMIFTTRAAADLFLRDAVRLALSDGAMHPRELTWIRSVAKANGITDETINAELDKYNGSDSNKPPTEFSPVRFRERQESLISS